MKLKKELKHGDNRSPYKKLATNSLAFLISNFGTKIITLVMVPLYTYILSTEEYGTIDLLTTINSLTIPIVFLCISDAVLRFTMDRSEEKKLTLFNGLIIWVIGTLILSALLPIAKFIWPESSNYLLLLGFLISSNCLLQITNQFLRSCDHTKEFAANGIIYTFAFASLNCLFLIAFKWAISGYLLSMIIANTICIVFSLLISKPWSFGKPYIEKSLIKRMLLYSLPLIPNALMWWVMDASDKFIISFYLGVSANGLYAVAKKIPTLIDSFHSIFNQAWQVSAIEEKDNKSSFTSIMYNTYYVLLFLVVSLLLSLSRPIITYVLGTSYKETWQYVPLLLVSVAFSSLSGFLSSIFIADKKPKIIFYTTITGAIINTALNFSLIPFFGINGAAFATAVGFGVVLIIREKILSKDNRIEINVNKLFLYASLSIQIIFYYCLEVWTATLLSFAIFIILMILYSKYIVLFAKKVFKKGQNI